MKTRADAIKFIILFVASLISVLCVLPYVLSVQGETIRSLPVPMEQLFIAQLLQSIILFAVAIAAGLYFAGRTGLGLPVLDAIVRKGDYRKVLRRIVGVSAVYGIAIACLIYVTDTAFTRFGAVITTHRNIVPPWQTLLAAVYGGISEEIIMRLFFVSFFVWLGMKIQKRHEPTNTVIIVSILVASVIFGLGHLPITSAVTVITPVVIVRAVVLNGTAGIVFGWLFWKLGLESAIIAHFTADIFLLTVLPLVFG